MKLENGNIRIEFLPEMGGKITSFYLKSVGFQLAAQNVKENNIKNNKMQQNHEQTEQKDFGDYAYGFDECFPCIDAESVDWNGRKLIYPNHGEIWSNSLSCTAQEDDSVLMHWFSSGSQYSYEKTYTLIDEGLKLHYKIVNESEEEFPCIWTWHGLMRYEEDMQILLPKHTKKIRNVLEHPKIGAKDDIYDLNNTVYNFNLVPSKDSRSMVKYYCEEKVEEGCCGFTYPSQGVRCTLTYDKEKLPYLGVWITAGGLDGAYNCALEPSNGFYDSISCARENNRLKILRSHECLEFDLVLKCLIC